MSENQRTSIYAASALVLLLLATLTFPSATVPEVLQDEGKAFFAGFTDFKAATSIEVTDFDTAAGEPSPPFRVELRDGLWRIPSKDNYPADGESRLANVSTAFIDLKRGVLRSTREQDQRTCGVVDPTADPSVPAEGRGRRVTLRDAQNNVLADLVIGKEVEGQQGLRYVRVYDEKRIYAVRLDLELSTEFADWIDTDLLKVEVADVTSITVNRYQVDERAIQMGRIEILPGERVVLGRTAAETWTLEGLQPTEQVATSPVTSLTTTLDALRIVDVVPREQARLHQAGFFATQEGIYSNEGEVMVDVRNGVRYTIRFGEVALGGEEGQARRFVVIDASVRLEALPDRTNAEAARTAERTAREANDRFGSWYYVITAESFDVLRPTRAVLVEPRTTPLVPPPDGGGGDGMFPPVGPPPGPVGPPPGPGG